MRSEVESSLENDGATSSQNQMLAELVQRIIVSKHFAKSTRLAALLAYLCEHSLRGESSKLTEYTIARQVFDRKGRFDPNADTIVRSHMVRLRQKLSLYFQEEGAVERIRITIPRGGYIPLVETQIPAPSVVPANAIGRFAVPHSEYLTTTPRGIEVQDSEPRRSAPNLNPTSHSAQQSLDDSSTTTSEITRRMRWNAKRLIALGLLGLALALALGGIYIRFARSTPKTGSALLWKRMLPKEQPVMFIAADSSLVLLHDHMTHDTSLSDYTSGRYLNELHALHQAGVNTMGLEVRRYTSIVDLQMTQWLTLLANDHHAALSIRYPRDVSLGEVKKENVILSGSRGANPWLELYEPALNFIISGIPEEHIMVVSNRNPHAGEPRRYVADQAPDHATYGVLAFLPGIDPTKNVLILQGTSVAGTEAISDLASDAKQLDSILHSFQRPDGSLAHFEVLLAGQYVNGASSRFKIVASRTYP